MLVQNLGTSKVCLHAWDGGHLNPAYFSHILSILHCTYKCVIGFKAIHTQSLHRQSWEWWHLKGFLQGLRPCRGSPPRKAEEHTSPGPWQWVSMPDAPILERWSWQQGGKSMSDSECSRCQHNRKINNRTTTCSPIQKLHCLLFQGWHNVLAKNLAFKLDSYICHLLLCDDYR